MTKVIIIMAAALGAVTIGASPVSASDCTRQFEKCLNDTWDLEGTAQTLANIECSAEYTGCVARKLLGW